MANARINSRHVTAIVTAICAAIVLAPVAVLAGGSTPAPIKVYVTDPHHSANRANVSPSGALSVGGTVDVGKVSGSVRVTPPTSFFDSCHNFSSFYCYPTTPTSPVVLEFVSLTADDTGGVPLCSIEDPIARLRRRSR